MTTDIATQAAQDMVREFLALPGGLFKRVYGDDIPTNDPYAPTFDDLETIARDDMPSTLSRTITLVANAHGWEQGRKLKIGNPWHPGPCIDVE